MFPIGRAQRVDVRASVGLAVALLDNDRLTRGMRDSRRPLRCDSYFCRADTGQEEA